MSRGFLPDTYVQGQFKKDRASTKNIKIEIKTHEFCTKPIHAFLKAEKLLQHLLIL